MEDTAESPTDSPTIEQQFDVLGGTAEFPSLDLSVTQETAGIDPESLEATAELPIAELPVADMEDTAELPTDAPTIEQQFDVLGGTAELPSLDLGDEDPVDDTLDSSSQPADETAEINLDDLGLDISGLEETELASLDDLDVTGENEALSITGLNEALEDPSEVMGRNPEIDDSLLDATGLTQVLSEDFAVETTSDVEADLHRMLSDADATMLAPGYGDDDTVEVSGDDDATMLAGLDDEDDFGFAKTEALPADVFTSNASLDETGELPAVASTDFDMDLDDLTAALEVSEMGDTVDQPRDDATVEQPRPSIAGAEDTSETLVLAPGDLSDDLHDARTMTEVGTKLDLARAYVDMGDPAGARSILEEVLDEGDDGQRQQAQQLLDSLS
jgi:pilus assembly protein FimV